MPVKRFPPGLRAAIKAAGGVLALARNLEIRAQCFYKWRRIPRQRIMQIHRLTGVPLSKLAPDLFRD